MVALCIADPMTVLKIQSQLEYGMEPMVFLPSSVELEGPNSLLVLQMRGHKR